MTSKINETIFSVLFCKDNGRPNASVSTLIAMSILKEGNGWTDEQLFSECQFNLQVMLALGLCNLYDNVPSDSAYYSFRKAMFEHYEQNGEDLYKKGFAEITHSQVETYLSLIHI